LRRRLQRAGLARTPQRTQAVGAQERRAEPREHRRQHRPPLQRLCHAGHAGADQHGVAGRAEQHHGRDVLAPQSLAQHIGVLGADGNDEHQAHEEPVEESGGGEFGRHGASLPCASA
jgi:hypothetical protein